MEAKTKQLGYALSFVELVVYGKAEAIARQVFEITKSFPREEAYSLTDQLRRSSRSIGAQIAEAWGKRRYERHFVSKLTDADAEQLETQHWINIALSCGYVNAPRASALTKELNEVGRMLHSMIDKADSFCSTVREEEAAYSSNSTPPSITDH